MAPLTEAYDQVGARYFEGRQFYPDETVQSNSRIVEFDSYPRTQMPARYLAPPPIFRASTEAIPARATSLLLSNVRFLLQNSSTMFLQ